MSHNLYKTKEGNYAYAGARELAWHRLGTTTKEAMTSKEAIKLAHLDYEVGIKELYTKINGSEIPIDTHNVTYNKDSGNIFGVVGSRYEVIQNWEAFDFLDGIVKDKIAMFETAGALGLGETIFITVKLPNNIRIKSNSEEQIENYLLFTSSHDGSGSIRVLFTPIRVVCNNTLNAALNGINSNNSWIIKHTKNARNRMFNIQQLFININNNIDALSNMFSRMNDFILTENQIRTVIYKSVLSKDEYILENENAIITGEIGTRKANLIYQLEKSIYKGVGQDIINPESAYGVFNGFTNYTQNVKKYKGDEDMFKSIYTKSSIADKAFKELSFMFN